MKQITAILLTIFIFVGCSVSKNIPQKYSYGSTQDIESLLDSIKAYNDVDFRTGIIWNYTEYDTNSGRDTTFMIYKKIKTKYHILIFDKQDSCYVYRYRID